MDLISHVRIGAAVYVHELIDKYGSVVTAKSRKFSAYNMRSHLNIVSGKVTDLGPFDSQGWAFPSINPLWAHRRLSVRIDFPMNNMYPHVDLLIRLGGVIVYAKLHGQHAVLDCLDIVGNLFLIMNKRPVI